MVDDICVTFATLGRELVDESLGNWLDVYSWLLDNIPNAYDITVKDYTHSSMVTNIEKEWNYSSRTPLYSSVMWMDECKPNEVRIIVKGATDSKPYVKIAIVKKDE